MPTPVHNFTQTQKRPCVRRTANEFTLVTLPDVKTKTGDRFLDSETANPSQPALLFLSLLFRGHTPISCGQPRNLHTPRSRGSGQIVIGLHPYPYLGRSSEGFREAHGHFCRNPGLSVDNPRKIGPGELQVRGQSGNGQTETLHVLLNNLARMRWFIHHLILSLSDSPGNRPKSRLRPRS